MNRNVETFIGCDTDYAEAGIILFGAPFDGTTSFRPGTRFGPAAMRGDSFGIETYSPYQDRDMGGLRICDTGDLELPFGNTEKVLEVIKDAAREILKEGKTPVLLGGEHLVSLPAITAAAERYPELHVIHLDAHTDLREDYLGEKLSHATVMRRIWEALGDGRIHQFGIRSGEKAEFSFAKEHTELHPFNLGGFAETVEALRGKPVYFTLDLDVLDPGLFRGTGTPEAGGVSFQELLGAIRQLRGLHLVGCDLVELCPVYDPSGVSTATACVLLREILLTMKGD